MTFKKAGGSHEDAECNGSEFGEPSSDSGWCLCRARLARLVLLVRKFTTSGLGSEIYG